MHDDIKERYNSEINLIGTMRFRKLLLVSGMLYLALYILDFYAYSTAAPAMFLSIRASVCVLFFLLYLLSYRPSFQNYINEFGQLAIFVGSLGISIMIYLTEGTGSSYYQGLILIVMTTFLVNGFSVFHNILLQLIILATYIVCATASPYTLNMDVFIQALFFLITSMVLMVFIVSIYTKQYKSEFEIRERLRKNQILLSKSYDQVKTEAEYDSLTGVFNRKYFMQKLNLKITEANLYNDNFFFIIFDVDHFKTLNDECGHLFGDEVLKAIIGAVKRNVRDNTIIGRYGGDEFVMLFGHGAKDQIINRMLTVSTAVTEIDLDFKGKALKLSISAGISEFKPQIGMTPKDLMAQADNALLDVKQMQRGGIKIHI